MPPRTSSISTSDLGVVTAPSPRSVLAFTLVFLALIDWSLNRFFPYPAEPSVDTPTSLQELFESGRSTTGKFHRMVQTQPLPWWLNGNWIGNPKLDVREGDGLRVAFFGNSFTERVSSHFREIAPSALVSDCIGTYSAPSHALGCYRKVRRSLRADWVVMGILASSWPLAHSFSNSSFVFSDPEAYTYPVYWLDPKGVLLEEAPRVQVRDDVGRRFTDPAFDAAWREQLARFDRRHSPLLYDESPLDRSALLRLARRAWAVRVRKSVEQSYAGPASLEPRLWSALVRTFASEAREDGRKPLVVLFQDFGFGDDLYRALEPELRVDRIPFVSSHQFFSANDPASFGEDRHDLPIYDRKLAAAVLAKIGGK